MYLKILNFFQIKITPIQIRLAIKLGFNGDFKKI